MSDFNMLFTFTVFPIGGGSEVTGPVSQAIESIAESGLDYQVTGGCTLVEGAWEEVVPVLGQCLRDLAEDHDRVWASITMDYHGGRAGRLKSSVGEVEEALHHSVRYSP
ncbi:MAG: thiamine-binding protein [Gemmatimonadota bacterium]